MADRIAFKRETDTEVIPRLIGKNIDKGDTIRDAVGHALTQPKQTLEDKENLSEGRKMDRKKTTLLESLQRLPISFGMGLSSCDRCKEIAREFVGK